MAQRQRLNSMSDHSHPSSDAASDNSEVFDMSDLRLNLETSCSTDELTESERQQIESALSALGTEVRKK